MASDVVVHTEGELATRLLDLSEIIGMCVFPCVDRGKPTDHFDRDEEKIGELRGGSIAVARWLRQGTISRQPTRHRGAPHNQLSLEGKTAPFEDEIGGGMEEMPEPFGEERAGVALVFRRVEVCGEGGSQCECRLLSARKIAVDRVVKGAKGSKLEARSQERAGLLPDVVLGSVSRKRAELKRQWRVLSKELICL